MVEYTAPPLSMTLQPSPADISTTLISQALLMSRVELFQIQPSPGDTSKEVPSKTPEFTVGEYPVALFPAPPSPGDTSQEVPFIAVLIFLEERSPVAPSPVQPSPAVRSPAVPSPALLFLKDRSVVPLPLPILPSPVEMSMGVLPSPVALLSLEAPSSARLPSPTLLKFMALLKFQAGLLKNLISPAEPSPILPLGV